MCIETQDIEHKCGFCSMKILRKQHQIRKAKNVFCSQKCHQSYQKDMGISQKTLRICVHCGKEFRRTSTKKSPNPKFCTIECWKTSREGKQARCHPNLPNHALGLCHLCYQRKCENVTTEEAKLARRNGMLWAKYKITQEQWDGMYTLQEGKCPICLGILHKFRGVAGKRAAAVDHDHKTNRIRGLVCHVCNRSRIGKNTVETTKRLLAFLESGFNGRDL